MLLPHKSLILVFLILAQLTILISSQSYILNKPVIGILSQPSVFNDLGYPGSNYSYIAASYVKYLEMAGAEVIPIQWDAPKSTLDMYFDQMNGFLLPGGNTSLSQNGQPTNFSLAAKYLIDKAIGANNAGNPVAVWGTCQGFQMISEIISNNYSLLINITNGYNISKSINITEDGKTSEMFKNMDPILMSELQNETLLYYHHYFTPDPASWTTNQFLIGNFTITSTTIDSFGNPYVASIEGIDLPIYGTQFHPEKNAFEWVANYDIKHSPAAIAAEQHFANFFVNQTRHSINLIESDDLQRLSIYNYMPIHSTKVTYEQLYFFENYNCTNSDNNMVFPNVPSEKLIFESIVLQE